MGVNARLQRKEINDAQFQNELDNLNNQLQNKEVTEESYRLRKDALEQSHAEIDKQIQMD